jgi:hypothetical protein
MSEIVEVAVVIDPKEFGLDELQGKRIEEAFVPVIAERENYAAIYAEIMAKQISPEVEQEARELRLKLVKVRTTTDAIHRNTKAFYLAGGRFVDAWKNMSNGTIEVMEARLKQIETTTERIELSRLAVIEKQRLDEIRKYTDIIPPQLAQMPDGVFEHYLLGAKLAHEKKAKEDKKAAAEKAKAEAAEAKERERIQAENLKLKKEADEIAAELAAERRRAAEAENELRLKRLEELRLQTQKEADDAKAKSAPDKVKLNAWIESIVTNIPECKSEDASSLAGRIYEKLEGFKRWAFVEIENNL